VRLGKPDDLNEYTKLNVDGVEVYRHESVSKLGDNAKLEVGIDSFLFKKRLVINEIL
jgi:hypothetical protein